MKGAVFLQKIATPLATLGPVGRAPFAPGTAGSVVAFGFFWLVLSHIPGVPLVCVCAVFAWAGAHVCGIAEVQLGKKDPGCIVLDEFVALPLCFVGWQPLAAIAPAWLVFLSGFLLFRFFDAVKPFGIRKLQDVSGGWGIVLDDVVAALATCLVLQVCIRAYSLL